MPRRKAWNGNPPRSPDEARRRLLDIAGTVVERVGLTKAGLSDVAEEAGVTRQTVYRYFDNAEDLFNSAAALSGGGFHHRMREHVMQQTTLAARIAECVVYCAREIPRDAQLAPLAIDNDAFTVDMVVGLGFIQEEMRHLAGESGLSLSDDAASELAELLFRLLHSFLLDPGKRSDASLRSFLHGWLVPLIESRLSG